MAEQLSLLDLDSDRDDGVGTVEVPDLSSRASLRAATGVFEQHMQHEGFSQNTAKAFLSDLNILTQFIGAGTAIGDISTSDLRRFTNWLVQGRGVPCSPKSLARRVTTLKVFFGWLTERGVLPRDPSDAVVHRPVSATLPQILSEAQVERVLAVTEELRRGERPDARPHLLVTLILNTGIKKGECMSIVLNHFDFTDPAQPVVWIRYANPRRRHKERKLRLPLWWPAVLAEYRTQYELKETLFACTARNLEYVLAGIAERADIAHGLSFEMLRWTCAVRDHQTGMKPDRLRQKLGISKITWREVSTKIAKLAAPAL